MKIETIILKNLILNEEYTRKTIPFIKEQYFQDGVEKIIFKSIFDYIEKYNSNPTNEVLFIELEKTSFNEEQYKAAVNYLESEITKESDAKQQWLLDETEQWCKDKAIYNAVLDGIHIIDGKDKTRTPDALPTLLSDALKVSFDTNVGHSYTEQSEDRYDFYHEVEEKIPFDLEFFNKITKGGLPNKTLNIALAGTGVGKSLFMCHVAASTLMQGKNVLYITLEMAEYKIAERIDANLMNISMDDLHDLPKYMYEDRFDKVRKKTQGKLIVKEYPTAAAHTGHFRNLLSELQLKRDFVPDIIFVDYLNICASSRFRASAAVNSYTYIKAIAEELRGLAVEFDLPIVSATQTTRQGFCLNINTEVELKNGMKKILKNIELGDELLSNEGYNTVTKIYPVLDKKQYLITTASGKKIMCSEDHRFPVGKNKTNKSISTGLEIGEKLNIYLFFALVVKYMLDKIITIEPIGTSKTIDIEVSGNHLFYANDILTHNSSTDIGLEDTSESFGLPATADFMFALISTDELQEMNQMLIKQLKNRYNDPTLNKKFILGVDRAKMKLYDVSQKAQEDLVDTGQEEEIIDRFADFKV